MSTTTTYDVRLRYLMDDRASRQMRGLERSAKGAGGALGRVTAGLVALGAGVFGMQKAAGALIGFNANMQDTKLQIGGMLALARKTDLSGELIRADRVFANLQKRAKSLPGTTQEYAKFAGMITQPIIDAGLGMKDLEDLTVNSVVAAKALGIEAEVAARDIDQAIRGQFHSVDPFTGKILGSAGFKGEEGRARFNAMDQAKRAQTLKGALMQPQLTQLAEAQGKTFSGIFSTLKDNLEQVIGKIGLPLFRALTEEVKNWNAWIDANGNRIETMAKSIGSALADGFGYVRDAVGFMVNHAGLLLAIGKVWLAVKAANMIGGLIGSAGGGLSNLLGMMRGEVTFLGRKAAAVHGPREQGGPALGVAGGASSAFGNAAAVVGALAAGYQFGAWLEDATGIGKGLGRALSDLTGHTTKAARALESVKNASDALDRDLHDAASQGSQRKGVMGTSAYYGLEGLRNNLAGQANAIRDWQRFVESGGKGDASRVLERKRLTDQFNAAGVDMTAVQDAGGTQAYLDRLGTDLTQQNQVLAMLPVEFGFYWNAGIAHLTSAQYASLDQEKAQADIMSLVLSRLQQGLPLDVGSAYATLAAAVDQQQLKMNEGKNAAKPKVNVTIQHFEVQSEDPDRFAFSFTEALRNTVKNPSGALDALREG